MSVVVECVDELKVKVAPKRFFKALITDAQHVLPEIVPHIFKTIEILEQGRDGGATGCIRRISFTDAIPFSHLKDKLEVVDTENLVVKINLFEGPMLGDNMDSIYSEKRFVASDDDGGCILKWKHHLNLKPGHTHVSQEQIHGLNQFSMAFLTSAEAYLVAHPDVCA
ncbi:pathogenesis-related protein STH-2-like [Henckelia pumila]|uniref:pathogenesis-related protein STH-2-like n=1 Tax=Henckelia pumila TaxID=405737 RepID=UPI003C6E9D10